MRFGGFLAVMVATTAMAASTSALAQSTSTVSLSEAQAAQRNAPAPQRRGLRLNDRGRWGLDFNLNQPVGRETDWGDVEAGAYYRLNDRLRVGAAAAAAVSTPEADPARAPETNGRAQPRVRLETIFKF